MYFLLILFFASFLGIIFMVGRKLVLLRNGQAMVGEKFPFEIIHPEKIRYLAVKNIKKYAHVGLIITIRFYVRFSNVLRKNYEEIKTKIKNVNNKKNANGDLVEKVEVSKFLKMISDYKHKIREIKHKIHEEENNS